MFPILRVPLPLPASSLEKSFAPSNRLARRTIFSAQSLALPSGTFQNLLLCKASSLDRSDTVGDHSVSRRLLRLARRRRRSPPERAPVACSAGYSSPDRAWSLVCPQALSSKGA